jgi:hypothetical protein
MISHGIMNSCRKLRNNYEGLGGLLLLLSITCGGSRPTLYGLATYRAGKQHTGQGFRRASLINDIEQAIRDQIKLLEIRDLVKPVGVGVVCANVFILATLTVRLVHSAWV